MRWFKHFTDNHRGRTIQTAFDQIGYQAYAVYILMELCAEKLERIPGRELAEVDSEFTFNRVYLQNQLRMKRKQTDLVLTLFSELGWFSSDTNDFQVRIKFPMLLELLDSDSKKSRLKRDEIALRTRLELDKEEELELEKNKTAKKKIKLENQGPSDPPKARAFIAAYCSRFKSRWGLNPHISKKDSGIAKRIADGLSEEKFEQYLDAYFSMPDAWLVKAKHPIATFESKLNEIVVYANSGSFTTSHQARQGDEFASNMILLQQVREGKA